MTRLAVLLALAFLLAACGGTPAAVSWAPPSGFTAIGDFAYQWVGPTQFPCSAPHCWAVYVVGRSACDHTVIGQINVTDARGTVLGAFSASAGTAAVGQQARLVFDVFQSDASHADLTRVACE